MSISGWIIGRFAADNQVAVDIAVLITSAWSEDRLLDRVAVVIGLTLIWINWTNDRWIRLMAKKLFWSNTNQDGSASLFITIDNGNQGAINQLSTRAILGGSKAQISGSAIEFN